MSHIIFTSSAGRPECVGPNPLNWTATEATLLATQYSMKRSMSIWVHWPSRKCQNNSMCSRTLWTFNLIQLCLSITWMEGEPLVIDFVSETDIPTLKTWLTTVFFLLLSSCPVVQCALSRPSTRSNRHICSSDAHTPHINRSQVN